MRARGDGSGDDAMHESEALLIGGYWTDFIVVTVGLVDQTGICSRCRFHQLFLKHGKPIQKDVFAQDNDVLGPVNTCFAPTLLREKA
jgi:hypothetical protein